jgi:hypothetical protein
MRAIAFCLMKTMGHLLRKPVKQNTSEISKFNANGLKVL